MEENKTLEKKDNEPNIISSENNPSIPNLDDKKEDNNKPDTKFLINAIIIVTIFTMLCALGLIIIMLLD